MIDHSTPTTAYSYGLSEKAFTVKYQKWCKKNGYNFSQDKALDSYTFDCGYFSVMSKTDTAKPLVEQVVPQLRAASASPTMLRNEVQSLAVSLPEYPVVMGIFGVGPALSPQLMEEIGDVHRFYSKKALVAFAGVDAPSYQPDQMEVRSQSISKYGSAALHRTLFLVMSTILRRSPADECLHNRCGQQVSENLPWHGYGLFREAVVPSN